MRVLLVEDDSNLREIYGARLEAEGFEILAANDGEEALAVAVREKPDLIITDIMMPKISGFDMLDILRTTPETKDIKVIVMTALCQDEDRKRGTDLGADNYIVKSQVTLVDVVSIVKDAISGGATASNATDGAAPAQAPTAQDDPQATATPDPASMQDEVKDFVDNDPLMNGTPPKPSSDDRSQQPPAA